MNKAQTITEGKAKSTTNLIKLVPICQHKV